MMVTAVSQDGAKITSWRSGTGPALVLVHGTAVDHTQRGVAATERVRRSCLRKMRLFKNETS